MNLKNRNNKQNKKSHKIVKVYLNKKFKVNKY